MRVSEATTGGVHDEAVDFMRIAAEADSFNRQEGLEDLKFSFGDQWPVQLQNSRTLEQRPMFTINEVDSYCRQVVNGIRQQRPRGKCHPVNDTSDVKIAEVITGIGRHIEVNSDADNAYDLSAEFAVRIGWGYFRLLTEYVRDDSFDQDIFIRQIDNPFSVYFDPNSVLPDGSDATKCLLTDLMTKAAFEKEYPGLDLSPFREGASGDSRSVDWITREDIRVAEYYRIERSKEKLIKLTDGTTLWEDEMPPANLLAQAQIGVLGDRMSWRKKVMWSKVYGRGELDSKTLPGRFIPVVPVYGVNIIIDGKRRKIGLVRNARDPQLMVNYWQTNITEAIALAPKAKWLVAEGQIEGHETEWQQANNRAFPYLEYKLTDIEGKDAPPPQRLQPEPPPAGMIQAAGLASQNLSRVLGMFDPVNLKHSGPKSGEALRQETGQSEQSNYHFYDNLTRSIKHGWRIILDWTPRVYDTQRVMRIIGYDGKPELITVNEKKIVEGVQTVLNDLTVGDYDVVMETGPGLNTKRQEATAALSEMLKGNKELWQVAGDLFFRGMDFPGADIIADRLAAVNPLAQIDKQSNVPPEAQMKMKAMQQQIEQLNQALQAAGVEIKFRHGIEQMKQEGETKRELMRQTSDAHEREITQAQKQHDTEVYALTAQNVAEINGLVKLLTSKTEHGNRLREMVQEFEHNVHLQQRELEAKSEQTETVQ